MTPMHAEGLLGRFEVPAARSLAASADMFELEDDDARTALMGVSAVMNDADVWGGRSVGVPAVVAGLCEAHARFGCLSLADVLAPAVALAREGFPGHAELQLQTVSVLREMREALARPRADTVGGHRGARRGGPR